MNYTKLKTTITILLGFLFLISLNAQNKINKKTNKIVKEGKMLFQSEMASWHGTDIFLENYKDTDNITGYFSYSELDESKCIFFSIKENRPIVIGTISFRGEINKESGKLNLEEREFTKTEESIFVLREKTIEVLQSDTLFKYYENTNLNIIPIITKKEKKVYILTAPEANGVVIFGNDYLINFNKQNKITSKKALHKNIIPIYYNEEEKAAITMHSHLPETGDFITATDICTLMLYGKYAEWESHNVVSEKYLNKWDCKKNELFIVPMKTIRKIQESNINQKE